MQYQLKVSAEIAQVEVDGNNFSRVNYNNTFRIEETKQLGEMDFEALTFVLGHLHDAMRTAGD